MNFTEKEIKQIDLHGLNVEEVERQIKILSEGLPATKVVAAATIGNGILRLDKEKMQALLTYFDENKSEFVLQKFVPASGAATRMFKEWVFFHLHYQVGKDYYERFVKKHNLTTFQPELDDFLNDFSGFAFYQDVMDVISQNLSGYFQLDENEQVWQLIHYVLSDEGLGYQNLPKALLKFHRYAKQGVTALEEHLKETTAYAQGKTAQGQVHFTISPQHVQPFTDWVNSLKQTYPVQIDYSFQKPETDTVMVYKEDNEIVRNDAGDIVFRPGGHGSLIDNIQDLDADIIFVKNIDNVQKGERQTESIAYKKILGAFLMQILEKSHAYLRKLRDEKPIHAELQEIEDFAKNLMNIHFIEGYDTLNNSGKRKYLAYKLNRPVRIAGMVVNTGEPGGGPFWVADENQLQSLQIVEKAQIDTKDEGQKSILQQSTHFNPVDLVLSIKDFEGNKFDLKDFVNENAAFLSEKSYKGKPVKVYERPGLWNGAMDNWNTIFVEVPMLTFSPVKTVVDLLKPEHQ